jgi:hypothetical protein
VHKIRYHTEAPQPPPILGPYRQRVAGQRARMESDMVLSQHRENAMADFGSVSVWLWRFRNHRQLFFGDPHKF